MSFHRCACGVLFLGALLKVTVAGQSAGPVALHSDEALFLAANREAMSKMMAGMVVKPVGDVDTDFTAVMIPHHQGAIDMAKAELRFGQNEKLRRIAQEIIVDQQAEIAAMRFAIAQQLSPSAHPPMGDN